MMIDAPPAFPNSKTRSPEYLQKQVMDLSKKMAALTSDSDRLRTIATLYNKYAHGIGPHPKEIIDREYQFIYRQLHRTDCDPLPPFRAAIDAVAGKTKNAEQQTKWNLDRPRYSPPLTEERQAERRKLSRVIIKNQRKRAIVRFVERILGVK